MHMARKIGRVKSAREPLETLLHPDRAKKIAEHPNSNLGVSRSKTESIIGYMHAFRDEESGGRVSELQESKIWNRMTVGSRADPPLPVKSGCEVISE